MFIVIIIRWNGIKLLGNTQFSTNNINTILTTTSQLFDITIHIIRQHKNSIKYAIYSNQTEFIQQLPFIEFIQKQNKHDVVIIINKQQQIAVALTQTQHCLTQPYQSFKYQRQTFINIHRKHLKRNNHPRQIQLQYKINDVVTYNKINATIIAIVDDANPQYYIIKTQTRTIATYQRNLKSYTNQFKRTKTQKRIYNKK